MKQWIKKHFPYILVGICIMWIVTSYYPSENPHIETVYITDTVTIYKTDTLELVSPIFITKKVVDTFYFYTKDSIKIALPVEQKRYTEPNKYDVYISGVNPNLDTIRVFNKTEYKTITNNTTNTVYKKEWGGYIGAQIQTFDSQVIPSIDFTITTPKSLSIGANIGIYNNKPIYGFKVGFNLFKK